MSEVVEDIWLHKFDALVHLGHRWKINDNKLQEMNQYGVAVKSLRIYDGTEHELAKKDHVIINLPQTRHLFEELLNE